MPTPLDQVRASDGDLGASQSLPGATNEPNEATPCAQAASIILAAFDDVPIRTRRSIGMDLRNSDEPFLAALGRVLVGQEGHLRGRIPWSSTRRAVALAVQFQQVDHLLETLPASPPWTFIRAALEIGATSTPTAHDLDPTLDLKRFYIGAIADGEPHLDVSAYSTIWSD